MESLHVQSSGGIVFIPVLLYKARRWILCGDDRWYTGVVSDNRTKKFSACFIPCHIIYYCRFGIHSPIITTRLFILVQLWPTAALQPHEPVRYYIRVF